LIVGNFGTKPVRFSDVDSITCVDARPEALPDTVCERGDRIARRPLVCGEAFDFLPSGLISAGTLDIAGEAVRRGLALTVNGSLIDMFSIFAGSLTETPNSAEIDDEANVRAEGCGDAGAFAMAACKRKGGLKQLEKCQIFLKERGRNKPVQQWQRRNDRQQTVLHSLYS
jgi:hypothetical protein